VHRYTRACKRRRKRIRVSFSQRETWKLFNFHRACATSNEPTNLSKCFSIVISQLFHASPTWEEIRSRWFGGIRVACNPIAGHNHADTSRWDISGRVQPREAVTRAWSAKDSHWLAFRLCGLRKLRPVYRLHNYLSAIASRLASVYPWTRVGSQYVHTRQWFVARRSNRDTLACARAPLARRHAPGIMHAAIQENSRRDRRPYCLSCVHGFPRDYRVSGRKGEGGTRKGERRIAIYMTSLIAMLLDKPKARSRVDWHARWWHFHSVSPTCRDE
jgi:hypothetical protein